MKKKIDYKKLTPQQIGKIHKEKVKKFFIGSNLPHHEVEWVSVWVKDEVRKAIRKERGLK